MKIQINNTVVDYLKAGDGDITLLFVHGSFLTKHYWREQVEYFKSSYTVVALDLPGHGHSGRDRKHWTMQLYGKDIADLIDALHLKNVILIGHSMGADVVLEAALLQPDVVKGIVAVEALKNAGTEMPVDVLQQMHTIVENLKINFADTMEAYVRQDLLTADTDPKIIHTIVHAYRHAYRPMATEVIAEAFHYTLRERELLQSLNQKIYIINVDYTPTDEEALKRYCSNGYELHFIHGTSHFPMMEESQVLNEALEKVIDKITEDSVPLPYRQYSHI
ncbi:MAG TPA: alpha/beta hydrolase [Ohtaekwangia sp.]|uniref:alpha/beta fold hydrolase n=1 Tax=Ohtaekwangia sp. TaxID=2066019 RepID=UPI002F9409DF